MILLTVMRIVLWKLIEYITVIIDLRFSKFICGLSAFQFEILTFAFKLLTLWILLLYKCEHILWLAVNLCVIVIHFSDVGLWVEAVHGASRHDPRVFIQIRPGRPTVLTTGEGFMFTISVSTVHSALTSSYNAKNKVLKCLTLWGLKYVWFFNAPQFSILTDYCEVVDICN